MYYKVISPPHIPTPTHPHSMRCSPEDGLLYFNLYKSSQLVQAYKVARDIMVCAKILLRSSATQ